MWGLIAVGTVVRLVLAWTTDGQPYDIQSFVIVRQALAHSHLHFYGDPALFNQGFRWPYPPGFLPFVGLAGAVNDVTGLAYTSLIRVPSILADAGIALLVQDFLGRSGASERTRLGAVALVALGPSFIVISGYHGQVDNTAILPAVAAAVVWLRAPADRRALYAGALIGVGGAMKTTVLFAALAFLPAVRSWREGVQLMGAAAAVPVLAVAPFFLNTPGDVREALGYHGFPGTSGLSFLLQPGLAEQLTRPVTRSGAVMFIFDRGQAIVVVALLAMTALTWRSRLRPVERASLVWLTFYVVTPVFFWQYLVWALPFFLMAGRFRLVVAVEAIGIVLAVIFYRAPWESSGIAVPYAIGMLGLWALFLASLVVGVARARSARPTAAAA
jgi:hypothetical protein